MNLNSLSWVIYLADIVGGISVLAALFSLIIGLGGCAIVGAVWVAFFDNTTRSTMPLKAPVITTALWVIFLFFFISVSILTPSKQAVLAIAASEAGEMVVTHPKAQKVFEDLTSLLEKELGEALSDGK